MANSNKQKLMKQVNAASSQSAVAINGSDDTLDLENSSLKEIIRQTTQRTTQKYGTKTNGKSLDYFTELSLSNVLIDSTIDPKDKKATKLANENPKQYFKKYMMEKQIADKTALLAGDLKSQINYQNYEAIFKHIPECSTALKIYRDNILSPDDFTKRIFNFDYTDTTDAQIKGIVKKNIENIVKKYKLNEKTVDIIQNTLLYGDEYYAILSLEDELDMLLRDPNLNQNILQENIQFFDVNRVDMQLDELDISLNESEKDAFKSFFDANNIQIVSESEIEKNPYGKEISKIINEHFVIDSKLSMLQERAEYEYSQKQKQASDFMSDIINPNQPKDKKHKVDDKPMFLNGSALRRLDPCRVLKLELDDICYGYYYYEEKEITNGKDVSDAGDYLGLVSGKSQSNVAAMGATGASLPVGNKSLSTENLTQVKYRLISDVFLKAISKKINKDYIRHNKDFKDFIYSVVQQESFMHKQIHLTFFTPDEVVHFKAPPIYKNITFFAKIYLAMLTNMIVINMGRGHDKRVFYIQTGLDEQFEAAISNTIESIKSKEFRLNDMDINTVVSLNPGALDDWFVPTNASGDRPIEIDTLAGMDLDIANNTFLDWLRKSMMNGMNIPANLIDAMGDVDYARTLSAQNANFVRSVVQYQLQFKEPFSKFIQTLYKNEYRFNDDGSSDTSETTNYEKIDVSFPSPASLNMTNMQEQINVVSAMADELSAILVPATTDGRNDEVRAKIRAEIFKDYFPSIDYERYQELIDTNFQIESARETIHSSIKNPPIDDQGFGGY